MDLKFYLSLFLRRLPYFAVLVALGTALGLTLASYIYFIGDAAVCYSTNEVSSVKKATTLACISLRYSLMNLGKVSMSTTLGVTLISYAGLRMRA